MLPPFLTSDPPGARGFGDALPGRGHPGDAGAMRRHAGAGPGEVPWDFHGTTWGFQWDLRGTHDKKGNV